MTIAEPSCPLCKQTESSPLDELDSFGFTISYYLCGNCGFVFQDSRKSMAADPEFYQKTYRKIYQDSSEPTSKDLYQQTKRAQEQAAWLRGLGYEKMDRILDVGASSGILLDTFHKEFGALPVGIEPGDAYRGLAIDKGIEMHASLEELSSSAPARFELVSLMHVLEHLEDPIGVLKQIRQTLLADDGILLVEVPNFYAHDSYELAHLSCFTQHTLEETLKQAGFEPIASRKHGMPRSKTLDLYLTVLAKPATKPISVVEPEKNVARKRKLGLLKRKLITRIAPSQTWLPLEGKA